VAGRRQRPRRRPLFCGRAAEGTVSTVSPAWVEAGPTVRSWGSGRARLGCASARRRASPLVERRARSDSSGVWAHKRLLGLITLGSPPQGSMGRTARAVPAHAAEARAGWFVRWPNRPLIKPCGGGCPCHGCLQDHREGHGP
jgi:hypothetical protein